VPVLYWWGGRVWLRCARASKLRDDGRHGGGGGGGGGGGDDDDDDDGGGGGGDAIGDPAIKNTKMPK